MGISTLRQKIAGAVVGVAVVANSVAGAFAASASPANQAELGPSLYVTNETRNDLGIPLSEEILAWANEDAKKPTDVVVIMPQDRERFWDILPPEISERLQKAPGWSKNLVESELDRRRGMPFTIPVPSLRGDKKAYCVIQLPERTDRPTFFTRIFAWDRDSQLRGSVGSVEQSMALTAAHESTHCQDSARPTLADEADADNKGMMKLARSWNTLFPYETAEDAQNLFKRFIGSRATALFRNPGNLHSTFSTLSIPGKSYAQSQARPVQERNIEKVQQSLTSMEIRINEGLQTLRPKVMASGQALSDHAMLYLVVKTLNRKQVFTDNLQKSMADAFLEQTANYYPDMVASADAWQERQPFDIASPAPARD
ncbi:MAG TPA: hypothetical protein PLO23_09130 [Alphaproteobacteria bacterium]|nr:hypothetical protein [Alphaproteobacteria bacterium]